MRNASFNDRQNAFKSHYALGRSILTPPDQNFCRPDINVIEERIIEFDNEPQVPSPLAKLPAPRIDYSNHLPQVLPEIAIMMLTAPRLSDTVDLIMYAED